MKQEKWENLMKALQGRFGKKPDLDAILFLIGLQELKSSKRKFSKEEKQDLMHVGICKLLSQEGFYKFEKYDADGWPHYVENNVLPPWNGAEQEARLKAYILKYFELQNPL